ncbi:enoyl-CoA hydratase/isomerase family protein [Solimonas sp. K1W22B-7]|uniref:enoyl-CoA hydratase/isomerase family protein n=1 Tax=Solimonas sp. K1W22B-7 TaxID=2303331 RepID=UPI0013C4E2B7|nr:enoyl-CoA hydratase-related protein [Solimonas sp. K1W22B-7]
MTEETATLYAVARGVATLTLNRPNNMNALSAELLDSLGENIERAGADPEVRMMVLTNEGGTFCAGADLKSANQRVPRYSLVQVLDMIQQSPKPVVARIAGHCMGGGVGLAAACDLSIAGDDVKLGFTEVRIGVAPAIISVVCLPKLRHADAMELFLSGEKITATRAAEIGLINYAVPAYLLDSRLAELIDKLVRGGPNALAACKQLVVRVPHMDRKAAFEWTAELSMGLFRAPEAADGIAAFRNRSPAPWVPADA